MNSLERSLQGGLVVSLVLLMMVFLWAGSLTSRMLSEGFVYRQLEIRAGDLLAGLETPPLALAAPRLADDIRLDRGYDSPLSGLYFDIRFDGWASLVSRSAWEQGFQLPVLAPGQQMRRRGIGVSGEPLLIWQGGFARDGRAFTVSTVSDIGPIEDRLGVFRWYFAGISIVLLVTLLAVQHVIIKRSVRQLDAVRRQLERLEHGQVESLSEDVPREIMPLVREFNRLLRRFDQRTRQSRNAVGNLAHALKGPMNLLMRAADTLPASAADDSNAAVSQNVERIRQLIESELKRARLAGRGGAGQVVDLDAELQALSGLLGQVYGERQIDIRWHIGPAVDLVHDRQDMLELIGNLLDNAVKWADSVVMLSLRSGDGLLLDVEDDGPGCTPEELARLTDRGVRLDESVAGHGLGLAIVKDIVDSYEGELSLGRSGTLGGFKVSIRLPGSA